MSADLGSPVAASPQPTFPQPEQLRSSPSSSLSFYPLVQNNTTSCIQLSHSQLPILKFTMAAPAAFSDIAKAANDVSPALCHSLFGFIFLTRIQP
jgi:hypothetical protein